MGVGRLIKCQCKIDVDINLEMLGDSSYGCGHFMFTPLLWSAFS